MIRALYDWTVKQAASKYAPWVLFLIAFAESSFLPIPPDILLIALILLHRQRWFVFFLICLVGSVTGGIAGYYIGFGLWEAVGPWFLDHVFSVAVFDKVRQLYIDHDFWVVFIAAFTPIPYKVFTISAGVAHLSLPSFIIASIVGRGGRFIIVSLLLYKFGPPIKAFIEKYLGLVTIILTVLLIGGFYALKFLAH